MTSEEAKKRRWKEHFERIVNNEAPEINNVWNITSEVETLPINASTITVEEVKVAIRKFKNNGSSGKDLITR